MDDTLDLVEDPSHSWIVFGKYIAFRVESLTWLFLSVSICALIVLNKLCLTNLEWNSILSGISSQIICVSTAHSGRGHLNDDSITAC